MTCYILVMWSFSSRHHSMVMDPEMLARLVFCFENNPERHDGIISGAQDSIGICVPVWCVIIMTITSGRRR